MNPTTTTRTTFRQRLLAITGVLGLWSMLHYFVALEPLGIVVSCLLTLLAFALVVYMTEGHQ